MLPTKVQVDKEVRVLIVLILKEVLIVLTNRAVEIDRHIQVETDRRIQVELIDLTQLVAVADEVRNLKR